MAIKAQGQAQTALEHIHNVVAEREYQRGYEQAKEEYDRELAEIKSSIKGYYYNKGYKNGLLSTSWGFRFLRQSERL